MRLTPNGECVRLGRSVRDLEGQGPRAVASERNEDATTGPRTSKSRSSRRRGV